MGKRTLTTSWRQYEKLSQTYLSSQEERQDIVEKLSELTKKVNADEIGKALHTLFVLPFFKNSKSIEFTNFFDSEIPKWQTLFDEERQILKIHPLSVFSFIHGIRDLNLPDRNSNFIGCRNISFITEIGKLPSIYVLFLMVLQRVAFLLEITHLEKRGGIIEVAEDEYYHTLLWAFKELELFVKKTYGVNIRAHYGIAWYEAEWITGI